MFHSLISAPSFPRRTSSYIKEPSIFYPTLTTIAFLDICTYRVSAANLLRD